MHNFPEKRLYVLWMVWCSRRQGLKCSFGICLLYILVTCFVVWEGHPNHDLIFCFYIAFFYSYNVYLKQYEVVTRKIFIIINFIMLESYILWWMFLYVLCFNIWDAVVVLRYERERERESWGALFRLIFNVFFMILNLNLNYMNKTYSCSVVLIIILVICNNKQIFVAKSLIKKSAICLNEENNKNL